MTLKSGCAATLFILWLAAAGARADAADAGARTSAFTIESAALGEERQVLVRTPHDWQPDRRYPVVYVLDGEWNFEYVAGYLDYMVDNGIYPPLIVTGIVNVDRNRDYVPRQDPHFPRTGGADSFLQFVQGEWIPTLQSRYSTDTHRILVGHSFGGVFTLHAFFSRPELFDAYIALGSSAWIAERVLFEEAEALFASDAEPKGFVYMAVGENDGGPTIPSSRQLAEVFEAQAPDTLEWSFSITPRTDHFSNFVTGLHEAFLAYFPTWGFADEVTDRANTSGAAGVREWFADKEATLGIRFQPPWFDLGVAALMLSRDEKHGEAAQALTGELRRRFPDNAYIAVYSASVYENTGNLEPASTEIERAIRLTQQQALHPNELQLESLTAQRDRIAGKLAESGQAGG